MGGIITAMHTYVLPSNAPGEWYVCHGDTNKIRQRKLLLGFANYNIDTYVTHHSYGCVQKPLSGQIP